MKYKLLGRSGLRVSELCLGCGTFGTAWGPMGSDKSESRLILEAFSEKGGNFIDTSNRYQEGMSEEYLGELIHPGRDRFVIGSKYSLVDGGSKGGDPNACGNHRKNLVRSVEGSLKRLKTDYIDLLWMHIWDYTTPVEEMMRALDDLVRAGKVLYIGASNIPGWILGQANTMAHFQGWTPFVANQIEYSIVERSAEPECLPMAHDMDMALVCWSALAGGIATGKYNKTLDSKQPHRLVDHVDPAKKNFWHPATVRNMAIMKEVNRIADKVGRPTAAVSLRWLMQQEVVTIPIFSARTLAQAKEDLEALDFALTPEQMRDLEIASQPALASVYPEVGPFPYPMLEYGSPALAGFYSRALLFGDVEYTILNHRRKYPYRYQPQTKSHG